MSSPNKPKPKASRLAKITNKQVWRRKTNPKNEAISPNDVGYQPTIKTNYFPNYIPSSQGYSFESLYKPYNLGQTSTLTPNFTPQPSLNHHDPYHFGQSSNHSPTNFRSNNTNSSHPHQPRDSFHITMEEQKFREELKQTQDLRDLNAMHIAQRNLLKPPSSPYSNCLPHTLNLDQVTNHTFYCPCCNFLRKQLVDLSEDISWIEYLLTRPHPIPPLTRYNIPISNTSAPYHSPSNK